MERISILLNLQQLAYFVLDFIFQNTHVLIGFDCVALYGAIYIPSIKLINSKRIKDPMLLNFQGISSIFLLIIH